MSPKEKTAARGDFVQVEVRDTGTGIAKEDQQDIFREFYQRGNPERDRNKGLGLGLALVQGLAHALGVELSLSSTPGKGSVFKSVLPVTETPVIQDSTVSFGAFPQNVRVLVIDDDAAVCAGMARLLESWACQCDTVSSISEALAIAALQYSALLLRTSKSFSIECRGLHWNGTAWRVLENLPLSGCACSRIGATP